MPNEHGPDFRIKVVGLQTPADVRIKISGLEELLRVASLGMTSYGDYNADVEYWRHHSNTQGLFDRDELRFTCDPLGPITGGGISSFLGSFVVSFSHPRVVSSTAWHSRVRSVPSGRTGRLFVGTHPDNDEKLLGLAIEQSNTSHAVVATTWYRNFAPTNNRIFDKEEFEITLRLVKDGTTAKTDPTLIAGNEDDWYYTVMGSERVTRDETPR